MELRVESGEVRRYLGWRSGEIDPALEQLIDRALRELRENVEPKEIARLFPLQWLAEDEVSVEGLAVRSHSLAVNLRDCREVYLFAATLGLGPDRLITRAQASGRLTYAMVLQAVGSAMIEAWCNVVNEELRRLEASRGHILRPRFSPGYGDLSLECQRGVFSLLGAQKNIGVTLTESLMMVPVKSVTAFIGVSSAPSATTSNRCGSCGRTECAYRV